MTKSESEKLPEPAEPPRGQARSADVPAPATHCCKRCRKPIEPDDSERFFERTGLCFWCAYVDPQG